MCDVGASYVCVPKDLKPCDKIKFTIDSLNESADITRNSAEKTKLQNARDDLQTQGCAAHTSENIPSVNQDPATSTAT